jgi:hypothetical protein
MGNTIVRWHQSLVAEAVSEEETGWTTPESL